MAITRTERRRNADTRRYNTQEAVGVTGVKVTVHIPEKVLNRREKINRIYDILVPVTENRK